jgi:hypothetical protein
MGGRGGDWVFMVQVDSLYICHTQRSTGFRYGKDRGTAAWMTLTAYSAQDPLGTILSEMGIFRQLIDKQLTRLSSGTILFLWTQ